MKKRKAVDRKTLGLGKYDAPLIIQYTRGSSDFKEGNLENPFHKDTMQYREWERGFNKAFFDKLKKVINYEFKERGRRMDEQKAQKNGI